MRRLITTLVLCVGLTAPLSAQQQVEVSVVPRVGTMDFGDEVYRTAILGSSVALGSRGVAEPAQTVGVGIELSGLVEGLTLSASLDRTVGLQTTVHMSGVAPGQLHYAWSRRVTDFSSSITHVGLDAMLPFQLALGPFDLFATAGIGIARYRFAPPRQTVEERNALLPVSGFSSSVRLGGGVRASVLGVTTSLTMIDAMNGYWDETRHHRITSFGVSFGL